MSDETVMKHAEAMSDALGDESWRSWTQEQAGEVKEVLDSLRRMVRDRDDGCCISCPPASNPAHDPVTCTCCQIALGATKERDAREAGHGEAFGIVLDRLTGAERGVVKARAEREDARRFARDLVEKVRRIQAHIEAGGANEELTAATVLCSEILTEDEWGTV